MGGLKEKTLKSIAWNSVQSFVNKGIQFFFMLFMTRLLTPKDYGMVGMLTVFMAVSQTIVDSGFGQALVRKTDRTLLDESTVFYFNIVASAFCYLVLFLIAPLVGTFYNLPDLTNMLRVMGLSLIIGSFASLQGLKYTINLDFRTPAIINLCCGIFSGIIGLILAFHGMGVWALVWQSVMTMTFSTVVYIIVSRWKPLWDFSWMSFREMFTFGSKLLTSRLIDIAYNNIYPLIIGKCYSATTLGFYSRAQNLAQFPVTNATNIIQGVVYPALCKIQGDEQRLINVYRKMLRIAVFVIFPFMVGFAVLSHPLINIVLTPKWGYTAVLLSILCVSMMWNPIQAINLSVLQVKGRSDVFLKLELIKKVLGITILVSTIPLGIEAMCYGIFVSNLISLFINIYYTGKIISLGFYSQMMDLLPALFLAFFMGSIVYLGNLYIVSDWYKVFIGVPLGIFVYCGILRFLHLSEFEDLIGIVKKHK